MVADFSELKTLGAIQAALSASLDAAFFIPILLHFFFPLPTYLIWVISNLLQTLTLYNYLVLKWPANVLLFDPALDDFIHMDTFDVTFVYD